MPSIGCFLWNLCGRLAWDSRLSISSFSVIKITSISLFDLSSISMFKLSSFSMFNLSRFYGIPATTCLKLRYNIEKWDKLASSNSEKRDKSDIEKLDNLNIEMLDKSNSEQWDACYFNNWKARYRQLRCVSNHHVACSNRSVACFKSLCC